MRASKYFASVAFIIGLAAFANTTYGLTPLQPQRKLLGEIPESYYRALVRSGNVFYKLFWDTRFSPDGEKVAFVVRENGRARVYINHKPGAWYDSVSLPFQAFSADSQHYYYLASKSGRSFIVLNGKEQKYYELKNGDLASRIDGTSLRLSPSGIPAYKVAEMGNSFQEYVVFNGHQGEKYSRIVKLTISPDGQRVYYYASRSDDTLGRTGTADFVIQELDGKIRQQGTVFYDSGTAAADKQAQIVFSPDGARLANTTRICKKDSVSINGIPLENPDENCMERDISEITFSPDSRHIAYLSQTVDSEKQPEKWRVILDSTLASNSFDEIKGLTFNSKQQLAYFARAGDQWYLIDGLVKHPVPVNFRDFNWSSVYFSPQNAYLYQYKSLNGETVLLFDGKQIEKNSSAGYPGFTPGGKVIFYIIKDVLETSLTIGGLRFQHDIIWPFLGGHTSFKFSENQIIYGALDGNKFYRIATKF